MPELGPAFGVAPNLALLQTLGKLTLGAQGRVWKFELYWETYD